MTSRSRGHDMTITINKKMQIRIGSHFSNCKIIFFEFQFEKKNNLKNLGFLASFTALGIVWQI